MAEFERSLCALHAGDRLVAVRLRQLERLPAGELLGRQFLLALQFGLGARLDGLRRSELRLGLRDRGLLRFDLLADARDCRLLGGELVARGVGRQPVITVVDAGDHVAGMNIGVVGDADRRNVAGNLGRQRRRVGMHISVVGGDDEPAGCEPVVAVPAAGGEHDGRRHPDQGLPRQLAAGRGLGRLGDGRQVVGRGVRAARRRHFGLARIGPALIIIGLGDQGKLDGLGGPLGGIRPTRTHQPARERGNFVLYETLRLHLSLRSKETRVLTERFGQTMFGKTGCQRFFDRTVRSLVEGMIGTPASAADSALGSEFEGELGYVGNC